MRTFNRLFIGFVVFITAGCTVKVNGEVHKFGVSGSEEEKKPGEQGATDTDKLAAELAGGGAATESTQSVTLKADFAPNPQVIPNLAVKVTDSIDKAPHGVSKCYGYVGESPSAVLTLPQGLKKARISAPGGELIVAEFGDRKYVCDETQSIGETPSVMMDEWPSGEVKLFVGGGQGKSFKYSIRIEDETRPVDVLWKSKVKAIDLAEIPKDPIIISEMTPATPGFKDSRGSCYQGFFHEIPEMAFELKRPLTDVTIEVRSAKPVQVAVLGPLTESGRDIRSSCFNDDRNTYSRMEAGFYGLKIGPEAQGEVLYHVIIRGKETSRNPIQPPLKFAEQISLEQSVIMWHYPQLDLKDVETSDANREALFLSAPKALFVFPKFNLDKTVASASGHANMDGRTGEKDLQGLPAPEFPKENEPLLLLNNSGYVMAADGALFKVNMKDMVADPGGAVALPATARNPTISFSQALAARGPEDAKAIAAYEKAQKDLTACENRINDAANARIDSIKATGYWRTQGAQIAAANEAADRQIESTCKPKALVKKQEALWAELAKTRTARRNASVAKTKPRVEALFK